MSFLCYHFSFYLLGIFPSLNVPCVFGPPGVFVSFSLLRSRSRNHRLGLGAHIGQITYALDIEVSHFWMLIYETNMPPIPSGFVFLSLLLGLHLWLYFGPNKLRNLLSKTITSISMLLSSFIYLLDIIFVFDELIFKPILELTWTVSFNITS